MVEDDPPARRVSPSPAETPGATAEKRASRSRTKDFALAKGKRLEARAPQGSMPQSKVPAQSPSLSTDTLFPSKKKYGKSQDSDTPRPMDEEPKRAPSPKPRGRPPAETVSSQAHSPARPKEQSQGLTPRLSEAQEATPSASGVALATLPEATILVRNPE